MAETLTPAERRARRQKRRNQRGGRDNKLNPQSPKGGYPGPNGGGGGNAGAVDFDNLVNEAISEKWTPEQYKQALYDSPKFQQEFPGYFREDGSTVFADGAQYKDTYEQYIHVAAQYGEKVSKEQFAGLMYNDIDPGEFSERLNVTDRISTLAKESPGGLEGFQKTLKELGIGDGSLKDVFEFASNSKLPEMYDAYEAVQIKAGGLNVSSADALGISKLIGDGTGAEDLKGVIGSIKEHRTDISPEMAEAGITEADLLKARAGGVDSKNVEALIKQKVAQRRAFGADRLRKETGFTEAGTVRIRGIESGEGSA